MELRRLGLIVNPCAGRGAGANLSAARAAIDALGPSQVLTGPGDLGAAALSGWRGPVEVNSPAKKTGRDQTQALAQAMIQAGVEALAVVGGDGTLADTAMVCAEHESPPPLLGIGAGSTNAGRLITVEAEAAATLNVARLRPEPMDAVLALCNGALLGLGFNDGVIGFTVVGTLDGRLRDLDAAERLKGAATPGMPRSIATAAARVARSSQNGLILLAQGESVGTVIVGFAEAAFFGKAVAGGVCLAAFTGLPGGCLVCNRPLALVEVDAPAVMSWPPLVSHYASLDEGSRIRVEGVQPGAALCVDGNPLRILQDADRAEFGLRRAAVTALRMSG